MKWLKAIDGLAIGFEFFALCIYALNLSLSPFSTAWIVLLVVKFLRLVSLIPSVSGSKSEGDVVVRGVAWLRDLTLKQNNYVVLMLFGVATLLEVLFTAIIDPLSRPVSVLSIFLTFLAVVATFLSNGLPIYIGTAPPLQAFVGRYAKVAVAPSPHANMKTMQRSLWDLFTASISSFRSLWSA